VRLRGDDGPVERPTYWLTRFILLRLLGVVYAVGFLVAANQILPLIGSDGLLPVKLFIDRARPIFGSTFSGFLHLPSLFWFIHSDMALLVAAWTGFVLACVVVAGFANALLLAVLWGLYMSFVHLGQDWYGYGWEVQLLETGFLAIFLCPLIDARPFPRREPPLPIARKSRSCAKLGADRPGPMQARGEVGEQFSHSYLLSRENVAALPGSTESGSTEFVRGPVL